MSREIPLHFDLEGQQMFAILHLPDETASRGLLVVTGGPTYRVGPHRTNVMLGRDLVEAGIPVMRFDFRGTGDSDGDLRTLKRGGPVLDDISAAIDTFFEQVPGLEEVVLWGLCRGAIRTLEYARQDHRVSGIVLLNPRVDNDKIEAVASIKHYYWQRLTNPNFYKKLLSGKLDVIQSMKQLSATIFTALKPRNKSTPANSAIKGKGPGSKDEYVPVETLIEEGFDQFRGSFLVILGGADLEAAKFKEVMKRSPGLQRRAKDPEVIIKNLADATHTFSNRESLDTVIQWTREWISTF